MIAVFRIPVLVEIALLLTSALLSIAAAIAATAPIPASNASGCRALATHYRTHHQALRFTADRVSSCTFDRPALALNCTHRYTDSYGSSSVTTETTKYSSIDDLINEVRVVAPLQKSLWSSSVQKNAKGTISSKVVYSYDPQGRVRRESSSQETITYNSWDSYGRPTAGNGKTQAAASRLRIQYGALTALTTKSSNFGAVTCTQVFDKAGNQTSTSCSGPGSFRSKSVTTLTASATVCR